MILIMSVDRISAQSARADQSLLLISQSPRDPETSIGAVAEGVGPASWSVIGHAFYAMQRKS